MKKKFYLLSILILALILLPVKVMAASLVSSIEVEGIGALNLERNSWNLSFTTTLDYANIIVTPANENVSLEGGGKVEIEPGANTIVITAKDGTNTETYTINLNVTKGSGSSTSTATTTTGESTTDPVKNPDTGGFISYESLLITVLAFAITSLLIKVKKVIHKIN